VPDDMRRPRNTFVKFSGSNNPNLKTPLVNCSSASESKFAEEIPESNNQTMSLLLIFHSFRESNKQIRKALHIRNSFPEGDNQTIKTLFINDMNISPSQMTAILTVTGVLSGCTLTAGGIILVVFVTKLRDSSNIPHNSNVYGPGSSYEQVPTSSLTELNSECDYARDHIYGPVT
jgi:hypothetical protein